MSPNPLRVREDTAVQEVFKLFALYNLNCIPVVDEHDRLQGSISVRDLEKCRQLFDLQEYLQIILAGMEPDIREQVQASFALDEPINLQAREVMSVRTLFVPPDESIEMVSFKMIATRNHHAIIVDESGHVLGIASSFDFLKLFNPQPAS